VSAELSSLGVMFATAPGYTPHPDPARHPARAVAGTALESAAARRARVSCRTLPGQSVIGRVNAGPVEAKPEPAPTPYEPANLGGYLVRNQAAPGIAVV